MASVSKSNQNNKSRKTVEKAKEADDDFDLMLSQPSSSTGSDDHALQLAIAEQLIATKEKKRKEKEKKFLGSAKRQLLQDLTNTSQTMQNAYQETDDLIAKFAVEYAASEDEIRKIWMQIGENRSKLLEIHQRRLALIDAKENTRSKSFVEGLAKQKHGVNDVWTILNGLSPQDLDEKTVI